MLTLQRVVTGPETCLYLPDQEATTEHLVVAHLTGAEYEARMNAGWRKFGRILFRPQCATCRECRPIRIPVASFTPSRSQRRATAQNSALTVRYDTPRFDQTRLALYNRYHAFRESVRGWPESEKTESDYRFLFLQSSIKNVEISIWDNETLCAIVLTDITPNVVSGVYHFYEPEREHQSLGTFAMLETIKLAEKLGKTWAYFGYYVADCASMSYKARFRPSELLSESGVWEPFIPVIPPKIDRSGS